MNELTYLTLVIFALAELIREGDSQDFGYEGGEDSAKVSLISSSQRSQLRPNHWGTKFQQCVGKHQSPINIEEHNVQVVDLLPIKYENFEVDTNISVINNGHTVQFKLETDEIPKISGGPLIGKYVFAQFHFHWGVNDDEGSESRINNNSFPMELHVVFYSASYGSFQAATEHPDGLCVISFLYSKIAEDNPEYAEIIDMLPQLHDVGSTAVLSQPLSLEHFLIPDKSHYYTYGGSLTTPPCSEVVTWIEFNRTIPLAHRQMDAFRHISSTHGTLNHNFRPTQHLHGRIIRTNRDINCKGSSNSKNNLLVLTISLIIACGSYLA